VRLHRADDGDFLTPTSFAQRFRAWGRPHAAHSASSPHNEAPGVLRTGEEAATEEIERGARDRVWRPSGGAMLAD
jgi:hypothetical protein